ncbi:MAG: stage II sporulation protein M [Syntrophobacteraceae bacterium]
MILDLEKFIAGQRETWRELERVLDDRERDPSRRMDLDEIKRFHLLYQRTSADLARLESFACEPDLSRYLESLVARGFAEMHEPERIPVRMSPLRWFFHDFPRVFRRRIKEFHLAAAALLVGALLGGALLLADSEAKETLLPFEHLLGSPSERVAREESEVNKGLADGKLTFSSQLMTNNIRVSIFCMALGTTWGIGTLILLFYNGAVLGAIVLDYCREGQTAFLLGWLLPHGSVEIPAILLGGQAGLVLAGALIGRRDGTSLNRRLKSVSSDLSTLIGGAAVMLVWAGFIEAFFSQYHQPVLSYSAKIGFGIAELAALSLLLGLGGRNRPSAGNACHG